MYINHNGQCVHLNYNLIHKHNLKKLHGKKNGFLKTKKKEVVLNPGLVKEPCLDLFFVNATVFFLNTHGD